MPLLALNTVLPQSMRAKYSLAIGIFPLGLMFASLLPLWRFANWLNTYFGMPVDSPFKDYPNGPVWVVALLSTTVVLMFSGYALGWLVNAVVARYILGWPAEKIRAIFLHSNVPAHWLKERSAAAGSADAQSIKKWEAQRKGGALRFIGLRGVLAWGGPMFLVMHVIPTLMDRRVSTIESLLLHVALWAFAGACFGAAIWYSSESNYRKLKQRSHK